MAQVKVDDTVTVIEVSQNREAKGKVTAIKDNGMLDIKLNDGTDLKDVPHTGGFLTSWYVQDKTERVAARQPEDKSVVELG